MAGLLYLSSEALGHKALCAMNGAAISQAAAFALLTAGPAACSLIRARITSSSDAGGSAPSAWLTTFLHLCDNSFVWEDTRGKPDALAISDCCRMRPQLPMSSQNLFHLLNPKTVHLAL